MAELSDEVRRLFEAANFAHVATVMPDGAPHSVPVWAGVVDGGRLAFFTQPSSRKARNVERDPRVAISIVDFDNPYRTATVRGRVVERREGEAALEVMDALSRRHTGQDFPMREGVLYVIEPGNVRFTELPFRHEPG